MGLALGVAAAVGLGAGCWFLFLRQTPQDFVQAYMDCIEARDYEKMYEMDSDFRHHHDTGGALHDKRFLAQLVMVGLSAGSRTGTHCLCSGERNEEALTGSGDRGSGGRGSDRLQFF